MKTKLFALALVSAFAFTACSDDDDAGSGGSGGTTPQTTAQKIANVWTGDELDILITSPLSPLPLIDSTTSYDFATYDFNSDGTVSIDSLGTPIVNGTWSLLPNNGMILSLNGAIDTVTIVKITSTQFHYNSNTTQTSPFGDLNIDITTKLER